MRAKKFTLSYEWPEPYDKQLPQLVKTVQSFQKLNNDDYFLLIVGETGTGKSSLGLHAYDLYAKEQVKISQVGLNQQDFAKAIKSATRQSKDGEPAFCMFDEANVFGREAMTPFNRDVIRLFLEIRGLKIFHIWCTPSLAMLDNALIDDKVNGLIFIFTKTRDRPRLYYYFTREDIDRMRREEGTKSTKARLTMDMLRKKAKYYATYRGCFRKYDGRLKKEYDDKKATKMEDRVESFFEKYGEDRLTATELSKEALVTQQTITNWANKCERDGIISPGTDYSVSAAGKKLFTRGGADKILDYCGKVAQNEVFESLNGPLSITPRKARRRP